MVDDLAAPDGAAADKSQIIALRVEYKARLLTFGKEFVLSVTVEVDGQIFISPERKRILYRLTRDSVKIEILGLGIHDRVVDNTPRDPHCHRYLAAFGSDIREPAAVHMSDVRNTDPCAFTLLVIGYDSRNSLMLIVLAAGENELPARSLVNKGHNDIRMSEILAFVAAEQLVPVIEADQTLAPEHLVHAVLVKIKYRAQMARARSAVAVRDLDIPALFHIGIVALQIHVAVGSLRGNEHRLAVRVAAGNVKAVRMRHSIVDRILRPFPLSRGLSADRIDPLENSRVKAEGQIGIQIVQEPDLIHSVPVQVKRYERTIPDSGNNAGS